MQTLFQYVLVLSALLTISCQTTKPPGPTEQPLSIHEQTAKALSKFKSTKTVLLAGASCEALEESSIEIPKTAHKELVYCNATFCSQYSQEGGNPYWIAVSSTEATLNSKAVKRKDDFKADSCPPTANPAVFKGTGIDLGHMQPAEDVRYSALAMKQAGSMLNVAAQPATFNRGVWAQIEKIVREKEEKAKRSWIVTGPVNPVSTQKIGKISVPEQYFKVVLSEAQDGTLTAYGFLATVAVKAKAKDLMVSVDVVEAATGYDFFSELPDKIEEQLEKDLTQM